MRALTGRGFDLPAQRCPPSYVPVLWVTAFLLFRSQNGESKTMQGNIKVIEQLNAASLLN